MKLLVIVLCLLSERFLGQWGARQRSYVSTSYSRMMLSLLAKSSELSPWVMLGLMVFPGLFGIGIAYYWFGHVWFGFLGFLLNLIIFYSCIGPENPFYPVYTDKSDDVGRYLTEVNGQLFAVLFWYIALGPLAVLLYRLVAWSKAQSLVEKQALLVIDVLDWLPVRMTTLLYLLVGHFQAGIASFSKGFFSVPAQNALLLNTCGLQALDGQNDSITMTEAERLVEHAVIACLVLLAAFTLV